MASRSVLRVARPVMKMTRQASTRAAVTAVVEPMTQKAIKGSALLGVAAVGLIAMNNDEQFVMQAKEAPVNWDAVKKDVLAVIAAEEERRSDGTGIGPTFVRLAWHASGTYSKHDQNYAAMAKDRAMQ